MASTARAADLETVRVGPQGRIVVPAEIRRALNIDEGTILAVRVVDGTLVLESRDAILRRWRERFSKVPAGVSLADELIEDRRREAAAEADGA